MAAVLPDLGGLAKIGDTEPELTSTAEAGTEGTTAEPAAESTAAQAAEAAKAAEAADQLAAMSVGDAQPESNGGEQPFVPPPAPEPLTEAEVRERIRFDNGQLSGAGLELEAVPEWLGQEYSGATRLDLSYNQLAALDHLERFKGLQELVLDNNCLADGLALPKLPKLHTLTLNKNSISDIEAFLDMAKQRLPQLRYLSLLGNQACPNELVEKDEDDYQRYRYLVLHSLPKLKFLDSRNVTKEELAEAKRVGQFMRVVRYQEQDEEPAAAPSQPSESSEPNSLYRPLPQDLRDAQTHRATIGQCKYVYYGRHSEGNRFIRNQDL
eukprot:m.414995 g.414995  ORF g.414995 m.414995 type:complete len:324 (-) comp20176_c5_seq8:369-1340(-)